MDKFVQRQPSQASTGDCPDVSQPTTSVSSKTSQGPSIVAENDKTTPTSMTDARLQRDLNSRSALLRMRAIYALKNPTKNAYTVFDVPHTEQDLIFDDEGESSD
ncbi:GL14362 [Drosophila persimilis]|uniref:GL14362 n=1 Tax=Drosophila persimilis TaxID=7234 RepID=B4GTI6_DROPE|nr:uncharacterized protein LOC6596762 [Drosophila persimilis]EDW25856.1 GL14362 [Drosophila persimilis]